ncbi:Ras family guanine nucleotide exchange factor CDC25 [Nakaseomyces bracarensis]|uniref:Ras family guanine nucleotide exchange factor CDC25 n=1 Tax=Nakaseomyces bracarensis TaxID=273131 RepID=UPI003871F878
MSSESLVQDGPLTSIHPVDVVVAQFEFSSPKDKYLDIQPGDMVYVLAKNPSGWWDGLIVDEKSDKATRGWFPQNYTRPLREHQRVFKRSSGRSSRRSSMNSLSRPAMSNNSHTSGSGNANTNGNHNVSMNTNTNTNTLNATSDSGIGAFLNVIGSRSMSRRGSSNISSPMMSATTGGTNITGTGGSVQQHSALSPNVRNSNEFGRSSSVTPLSHRRTLSRSSSRSASSIEVKSHLEPHVRTVESEPEIKVLSLEEIEMIINSLHSDITTTWVPVPIVTPDDNSNTQDKLVYYNKDLDLYCSELPLISNLNFESDLHANRETKFPTSDHLVSLKPRCIKNMTVTSPRASDQDIPMEEDESQKEKAPPKTTKDDESKKTVETSETESRKQQHSFKQPMMSRNDIFYQLTRDITTWSELHDLTIYYAKLAHRMFVADNKYNFMKFFDLTSNYITFLVLACRLIQNQEKFKNFPKDIKKVFKHMISGLGKINVNSRLFFDPNLRKSNQSGSMENYGVSDNHSTLANINDRNIEGEKIDETFDDIPGSTAISPLTGKRNVSTSTTDTLIPYKNNTSSSLISPTDIDANQFYVHSLSNLQRTSISASTPRTSIQSGGINGSITTPLNKERLSKTFTKTLYELIDVEFSKLFKHIQYLHHLLQISVIGADDSLPQLLPRFLKSSFNGGSWSNPFSNFINADSVHDHKLSTSTSLRTSNHDLASRSHNSSISGVQGKVTETLAQTAGSLGTTNETSIQHSNSTGNIPHLTTQPTYGTSTARSNLNRQLMRSRAQKRRPKYPLNNDTLGTMNRISSQIYDRLNSLNGEHLNIINQPKTRMRNLEINSSIYEQVNQNNQLLDILENLDLTIFINLKKLIKVPTATLDPESKEFLVHTMSSISSVLIEFFDIKQAFHDIVMRLIMTSQQTTLDDPFSFSSMRSNLIVGYYEPMKRNANMNSKNFGQRKTERQASEIYRALVNQDVECNGMEFLNSSDDFIDACEKYVEIANLSCIVVEQLIEERENLLNYAARMMKNKLTTELLKGEQERWFDIYSENNSDEEDEPMRENIEPIYEVESNQAETSGQFKELPWFLLPEYEDDLIYDAKGKIRGGTKEALVEHLTSHNVIDASFNVTLLMTFRSFMTTREFFYALIYRYNLYPPEGLSFDEYNIWIEKKLNPVKCRVVNIMKTFLSQYWTAKYNESGVGVIVNFAKMAVSEKIPGSDVLLSTINERIFGSEAQTPSEGNTFNYDGNRGSEASSETASLKLEKSLRYSNILDVEPFLYASQLTLMEHDLYLRITMFECLDRAWGNKYCDMGGSPNISKFIANANSLTNYVSYTIVNNTEPLQRSKLIQYFITVAQHCKELNNFSSMTAIVSALYSSPIYRLKQTWNMIPPETKEVLDTLNSLMDSKRNFIKYRELLRSVKDVACVPFFGVYLSDLTFTFAGNTDFIHGTIDVINFGKRSKIASIIEGILSFKKFHYKLKRLDDIQTCIEEGLEDIPHIEKQYQLSLEVEPRPENKSGGNVGHHSHERHNKASDQEFTDDKTNNFLNFRRKKQSSKLFG